MRPVSKAGKRRKPDHITKQDEANFAAAVKAVYRAKLTGAPIDPQLAPSMKERWPDVCRVAYGFVATRQAIDRRFKEAVAEEMQEGLREALAMHDAMTTGAAHPFWAFMEGMRTGTHRPGRMPPNLIDQMGRDWALGIVCALEQAGHKHAKREVVRMCAEEGVTLDQRQLRSWEDARRRSDDPGAPDRFAVDILNHVKEKMNDELSLADRILKAVRPQTQMYLQQPEPKSGG
jgi:hypothetical protein